MRWRGDLFSLETLNGWGVFLPKQYWRERVLRSWQCLVMTESWLRLINKPNKPADIIWLFSARGVKFVANCTCNIISIKNTQVLVFYFGREGPRDQYASFVYTKYKDEPGVTEVVWWLDGWKRGIYWLPTFIGLSCTNVNPASANIEPNWMADYMSLRATWDDSERGGASVTHIQQPGIWCGLTLTTECTSVHF